jgi:hypothetical protein
LSFEEPMSVIRRVTAPALFPPPSYSHASVVEAGTKLAFLAGAVPLDERGRSSARATPYGRPSR